MANRVLLGERNGDYGLWISKPGQNVLTAGDGQLLFSPDFPILQVLYSQIIQTSGSGGSANYTVSWPDPGYYAFAWCFSDQANAFYTFNSQSSITVTANNNVASNIYIIVFNVPRHP